MGCNSRKVSGPKLENIKKPSVASNACQARNKDVGSDAVCNAILAHTMSATWACCANSVLRKNATGSWRQRCHQGFANACLNVCKREAQSSSTQHLACGYRALISEWVSIPPFTGSQSTHRFGCKRIHCKRSSMRLPISSCNHGVSRWFHCVQRALAIGSMVGTRSWRSALGIAYSV